MGALSLACFLPPQAGKLTAAAARQQYAMCVKGCYANLQNVRAREEEMEAAATQALKKARAGLKLDEAVCDYKEFPEWEVWAADQDRVLSRQKVFVVDGPSRIGKSAYVLSKLREQRATRQDPLPDGHMKKTLIVNCMNVLDPDLKRFRCMEHDSVLFDEGSPDMVQRHRDLMQAPRRDITLGSSATGCYTYAVCLFRVRLVITANKWQEQLEALSPSDREWVIANTVVLRVTDKMFLPKQSFREQSAPTCAASSGQPSGLAPHLAAAGA